MKEREAWDPDLDSWLRPISLLIHILSLCYVDEWLSNAEKLF